jgi:hypothetical protein
VQGASSTTETSVARFLSTEAYTASRLYAQLGANVPSGETVTVTLNDNASATALTFTIAGGASSGNDTLHTVTFTPGHLYDIAFNCRGGTAAITGPVQIGLGLK